jgi:hypothetical protein
MGIETFNNSAEKPNEIAKKLSEKARFFEQALYMRDQNGLSVLLDDVNRGIFQSSLEQIDSLSLSEDIDSKDMEKTLNSLAESLYYFGQADRGVSMSEDLSSLELLSQCLNDFVQVLTELKLSLEGVDVSKYEIPLKLLSELTETILPQRLDFIDRYYRAVQAAGGY